MRDSSADTVRRRFHSRGIHGSRRNRPGLLTAAAVGEPLVFPGTDVTEPVAPVAPHPGITRPATGAGPRREGLDGNFQAGGEFSSAEPCFVAGSRVRTRATRTVASSRR